MNIYGLDMDDSDPRALSYHSNDLAGMSTSKVGLGQSLKDYWRVPTYVMKNDNEEDMLGTGKPHPVFSARLVTAMREQGITGVEYYPVRVVHVDGRPLGEYEHVNIFSVADVLDLECSIYTVCDVANYGKAFILIKPVLRRERAFDQDMFRIPQSPPGIYVSERFRRLCLDMKCTGMRFYEQRVV